MKNTIIELSNIEIYKHCMLNRETGEREYNNGKKQTPYFSGFYYEEDNLFFALFPTKNGPVMFYEGKEYILTKDLHIRVIKNENEREFCIDEYNIFIKYHTSQYIGFDVWSEEEDVDLFYQIEKMYKNDDYYKKFTRDNIM